MGGRVWTDEERARLREWWATDTRIEDFAVHFPSRAPQSIERIGRKMGLPKRRADREWKPEEDAIVREIWFQKGSLKLHSRRLPGRSPDAIKSRAARLSLPTDRGDLKCNRFSWVTLAIDAELKKGTPLTAAQLAEATGASEVRINVLFADGKAGGRYHVAGYARRSGKGQWAALWALGPGEDAVKPAPLTSREVQRRLYAKTRIRAGRFNPFLAAAGLVQVPVHDRGRVHQQLTADAEDSEQAA